MAAESTGTAPTPALPRTIPHAVVASAARDGKRLAVVDDDRRISYAELEQAMLTVAAAFVRLGVGPGERVAIWAPNSLDWIIACLGAQAARAVMVPLNTRYRGLEAQYVLNRSRARVLVVIEQFLGVCYPKLLDGLDLPHLRATVRLDSAERRSGEWTRMLAEAGADATAMAEAASRLAALTGDHASDILFTSGTTGDPKGVVTNHAQNVALYDRWAAATGLRSGDRYLVVFPFFHSAGYKAGCVASFIRGATVYPEPVFDAARLMENVVREQITVLPGPPTLFQTLLDAPGSRGGKFASLRIAVTGASMVPPTLIEAMRRELGIRTVVTGYGLTETCGTVTMTSEDDSAEIVVTSCGRALPGVEVRCVGGNGRDVPTGDPGEIVVRGINIMQGYLDDPVATAETIDAEGWLHTGDIGTLDAQGYLRITDRKKDMFVVGGFNCYPAEIEKMMLRHEAIGQVAVIGVPDARLGEVAKAFVVPKAGQTLDAEQLIAWCREVMANFKAPRYVEIVTSLPVNATGKVQKFRLQSRSV